MLFRHSRVKLAQDQVVARRDFLRGLSAASLAAGTLSWTDLVSAHADDLRSRGKACILLWMQGGPSQFETFAPKPGHANGGETKAIATAVPGIQIADNLPEVAKVMDRMTVFRSVTTKEGNHQRATFLLHTGYLPSASVKYPAFGSIAGKELAQSSLELPSFVRVGGGIRNAGGGGLLGVDYDPFVMDNPEAAPRNTQPTTSVDRYKRRLSLLDRLEASDYASNEGKQEVRDHKKLYGQAARMILSPQMTAFDLDKESSSTKEKYGSGQFASGCLLARRLVESGVPFVEVFSNGWDTHNDGFNQVKSNCKQIDQPMAALIRDLEERGLLDSTLVIWMGEFGRTPRINPRGGRDHYPRAFSVALAGCGVQGGQVIGETDPSGSDVSQRPIPIGDLFQTYSHALGIDSSKEHMSAIGRPIKIVDGGSPVMEAFG